MDLETLRQAINSGQINWRRHVLERMIERGITRSRVIETLEKGEVIEDYGQDKPFPSALILRFANGSPLHVVAALDQEKPLAFVITVYEPNSDIFGSDYRSRKKK